MFLLCTERMSDEGDDQKREFCCSGWNSSTGVDWIDMPERESLTLSHDPTLQPEISTNNQAMIQCFHAYPTVEKPWAFIFHSSMKASKDSTVGITVFHEVRLAVINIRGRLKAMLCLASPQRSCTATSYSCSSRSGNHARVRTAPCDWRLTRARGLMHTRMHVAYLSLVALSGYAAVWRWRTSVKLAWHGSERWNWWVNEMRTRIRPTSVKALIAKLYSLREICSSPQTCPIIQWSH